MRVVFARDTFVKTAPDGMPRAFRRGEPVPADDPIVAMSPDDFDDRSPIEQASATPGDRRRR